MRAGAAAVGRWLVALATAAVTPQGSQWPWGTSAGTGDGRANDGAYAPEPEAFVRRACKFRPLPSDLDEGFRGPDGSARISDVFGLPVVALARGGHNITAKVGQDFWLGLSVQVPYATHALLSVSVITGDKMVKCIHTWGAGGRMKQCVINHMALSSGTLMLRFSAAGMGDAAAPAEGLANPTACISVRVDLEIASSQVVDAAGACRGSIEVPPGISSAEVAMAPKGYTARSREGVVWSSRIPRQSTGGEHMLKLYARLTFPSLVQPMQILLEESETDAPQDEPVCRRRCLSGTAVPSGQVMGHLLPLGLTFTLWILAMDTGSDRCVNFDFELSLSRVATDKIHWHYLGPPAWLCEGAAWPARLEQLPADSKSILQGMESTSGRGVFRSRRFALRDVFELTRPPHDRSSGGDAAPNGGLHTLELSVAEWSVLRLTTHGATVPARPLLLPGRASAAWRQLGTGSELPTAQIPAAGGEFRYSIHVELEPGEYTIAFALDLAVGGLRPCASVFLRLELDPWDGAAGSSGVRRGACAYDAGPSMLDEQAAREPVPLESLGSRAEDYQVTLPRPRDAHLPAGSQAERDVEIIARASFLHATSTRGPTFLQARIESPFPEADLQIQVYGSGVPLGEPQPAADGNGYLVVVGPIAARAAGNGALSDESRYEVVLFHVPRRSTSRAPQGPRSQLCVTFSVDLAVVSAAPASTSLALSSLAPQMPGTAVCSLTAPEMPAQVRARAGWPVIIDGEFLLPQSGQHFIQVIGGDLIGAALLRVVVTSSDAEVRVASADGASLPLTGLAEDHILLVRESGFSALNKHVVVQVGRLPTPSVCPTLHLHLTLMSLADLPRCPSLANQAQSAGSLRELESRLTEALVSQPVDNTLLHTFKVPLPALGVLVSARFNVPSAVAELRFELGVEPPWLPLEAFIHTAHEREKVWFRARSVGPRLVMIVPSLPQGSYVLRIRSWEEVNGGLDAVRESCGLVVGSVALVEAAGQDTSNIRQEMLNFPELLAVIPLPSSLTPSWTKPGYGQVSSQMYGIPSSGATTTMNIVEPSLLRVLAEPANILTPRILIEVKSGDEVIMSETELIGSRATRLSTPGTYTLHLTPDVLGCLTCSGRSLPFMLTMGLVGLESIEKPTSADRSLGCPSSLPALSLGDAPDNGEQTHAWRRKQQLRVERLQSPLTMPVRVPRPAVVLIAAWSQFADRYVRVAMKTEEGLWVGEQRMRLSALEIELPPGDYVLQVEEPSEVFPPLTGCLAFGLLVAQAAFLPPVIQSRNGHHGLHLGPTSQAGSAPWSVVLGARCDGQGASPLPLDLVSNSGGSMSLGGPLDGNGRVLVRQRMLLTDIHDGRKKVYLRPTSDSIARITIVSGDAAGVEVVLEEGSHAAISPHAVWSHGGSGWSTMHKFTYVTGGMWLSFHREHRDAILSGCAAFDLMLQMAPLNDLVEMMHCPRSGSSSFADLVGRALSAGQAQGVVLASAGNKFTEAIVITLDAPALVEVEVQFNFLLSNVDLWSEPSASPLPRHAPEFGAFGDAGAPLNAHVVLRLRLPAGKHTVRASHEATLLDGGVGISESGNCFPLGVSVRHTSWSEGAPAILASTALYAPVSPASDVVMVALAPSRVQQLPVIADVPPTSTTHTREAAVYTWDSAVIFSAITSRQGHSVQLGQSNLWVMPCRFQNSPDSAGGDIWFTFGERPNPPWSGHEQPLSSAPRRPWPPRMAPTAAPSQPDLSARPAASGLPAPASLRGPEAAPPEPEGQLVVAGPVAMASLRGPEAAPVGAADHVSTPRGPSRTFTFAHLACWIALLLLVLCVSRGTAASGALRGFKTWFLQQLLEPGVRQRELSSVVEITPQERRARECYGATRM